MAASGDGAPTQGVRAVYADQRRELDGYEAELRAILAADVAALNRRARELDLGDIASPAAGAR